MCFVLYLLCRSVEDRYGEDLQHGQKPVAYYMISWHRRVKRHLILGQQTVMLGRASSETNVHAVFRFVGGPKMSVSHTVHNWLGPQLTYKRYMYSLEPRTYHEYVISMYSMA